jgi:hypothetical protein
MLMSRLAVPAVATSAPKASIIVGMMNSPPATPSSRAILQTAYGKPFSGKGLDNFMADCIGAAGLPDRCVTHGLRKAGARDASPRPAAPPTKSPRSPGTGRWPRSNAIRERRNRLV